MKSITIRLSFLVWILLIIDPSNATKPQDKQQIKANCMPFKIDPLSTSTCMKTSLDNNNSFLQLNPTKQINIDVNTECISRRSLVSELRTVFNMNEEICKQKQANLVENAFENCQKYQNDFNPRRSCLNGRCLELLSISPGGSIGDNEIGRVNGVFSDLSEINADGIIGFDLRCQELGFNINKNCISSTNSSIFNTIQDFKFLILHSQNLFHKTSCVNQLLINTQYEKFLDAVHAFQNYLQRDQPQSQFRLLEDQSNTQGDSNHTNSSQDPVKQDQISKDKQSSSSDSTFIVIAGVIASLLILGCCGGIIYIRRNNDSGFASLTANIESDKQRMIKPGGMMSMGSSSNGNASNSNNIEGNNQDQQQEGGEMNSQGIKNANPRKFSTRAPNSNASSKNGEEKRITEGNNSLKQFQDTHSAIELKLESNHTKNIPDAPQNYVKQKKNNKLKSKGEIGLAGSESADQNQPRGQVNNGPAESPAGENDQPQGQAKHLDTSVQNNFFSIDGEDQEKHDKIMDSIHVDYESDDTTYSNVFNLEGEESCKPNTNRKKKKQKKENHLFFEDVNQE